MGSSQSAIQEHQATFHKVRRKEGGGGQRGRKERERRERKLQSLPIKLSEIYHKPG